MKPSPITLRSSPVEDKKLGFPFSENGPSAIQGEGATSAFSDFREWKERGVTTPYETWAHAKDSFPLVTFDKRKKKHVWKGWGITSAKSRFGEGKYVVGMEAKVAT